MAPGDSIFFVSPQSWSGNQVSKHHYAKQFAKQDYKVFFINPPITQFLKNRIDIQEEAKVKIVTVNIPIPYWVKFKIPLLYKSLVSRQFKKLIKKIGQPDILWNFDNETYFQQEHLFTGLRVFHPVDAFINHYSKDYNRIYDFGFSVSKDILKNIPLNKKLFVNHAIGEVFESAAKNKLQLDSIPRPSRERIKVGYVGNLSIRFLDHKNLLSIIKSNPAVDFNFIGNYDSQDSNVMRLKSQRNVSLLGVVKGQSLYDTISGYDVLLLCYLKQPGYFGDNSHKLLEYLATGLPIVSSRLSVYEGNKLIQMSEKTDNSDLIDVFNKTIKELAKHKTLELQRQRLKLALNHTYASNLDSMIEYINIESFKH